MSITAKILASYFLLGLLVLVLFDLVTKRIRTNLEKSTLDARVKVASTTHGSYLGPRLGKLALIGVTWLCWPAVLIGAVTKEKEKEKEDNQNEDQGDSNV